MKNTIFGFQFGTLLLLFSLAAAAQNADTKAPAAAAALTPAETHAFITDGRQTVWAFNKVYSISSNEGENNCILVNGIIMDCFSEPDLPFATKIFAYEGPGMDKAHLVVFFGSSDQRRLGHSGGLYFYDQGDFNSWDHIRVNGIRDITVFKGQLLAISNLGSGGGDLYQHQRTTVYESGDFSSYSVSFQPLSFINTGSDLFIIGKEDGVYRKYAYTTWGKAPIYMGDISATEMRFAESKLTERLKPVDPPVTTEQAPEKPAEKPPQIPAEKQEEKKKK